MSTPMGRDTIATSGDGEGRRERRRSGQMPAMAARVELREITQDSLRAVLDLAVDPEQEPYVATNARSIAEAHFEPRAWFRGVYADDDPAGFVMAFRDPPKEFGCGAS